MALLFLSQLPLKKITFYSVQIYAQRDIFIKLRLSGIRMKLSSVTCENRMEELKKSVTLLNSLNDVPIKNVYVLRKLF